MLSHVSGTQEIDEFGDDLEDNDFLLAESNAHKRALDDTRNHNVPASKRTKIGSNDQTFAIPRAILKKIWGFPDFRLKQALAISHLLSRRNALVVFPTGGGKSLVYQVPALAFDELDLACDEPQGGGLTLVVSPLIALMKVCPKDQSAKIDY